MVFAFNARAACHPGPSMNVQITRLARSLPQQAPYRRIRSQPVAFLLLGTLGTLGALLAPASAAPRRGFGAVLRRRGLQETTHERLGDTALQYSLANRRGGPDGRRQPGRNSWVHQKGSTYRTAPAQGTAGHHRYSVRRSGFDPHQPLLLAPSAAKSTATSAEVQQQARLDLGHRPRRLVQRRTKPLTATLRILRDATSSSSGGVHRLGAGAVSREALAAPAQAPYWWDAITYGGGPVLGASGPVTVYPIYYGTWNTTAGRRLQDSVAAFVRSLSSGAGEQAPEGVASVRGWWEIASQYYMIDPTGGKQYVSSKVLLGKAVFDKFSQGDTWDDDSGSTWKVVTRQLQRRVLPLNPNGVYVVLTSPDVAIPADQNQMLGCTCGWHSFDRFWGHNIVFALVLEASFCAFCSHYPSTSPNATPGADGTVNTLAHEVVEAVTNPMLSTGWTLGMQENADYCQYSYGVTYSSHGGAHTYNMVGLNSSLFYVQDNFSPVTQRCQQQGNSSAVAEDVGPGIPPFAPPASPPPPSPPYPPNPPYSPQPPFWTDQPSAWATPPSDWWEWGATPPPAYSEGEPPDGGLGPGGSWMGSPPTINPTGGRRPPPYQRVASPPMGANPLTFTPLFSRSNAAPFPAPAAVPAPPATQTPSTVAVPTPVLIVVVCVCAVGVVSFLVLCFLAVQWRTRVAREAKISAQLRDSLAGAPAQNPSVGVRDGQRDIPEAATQTPPA